MVKQHEDPGCVGELRQKGPPGGRGTPNRGDLAPPKRPPRFPDKTPPRHPSDLSPGPGVDLPSNPPSTAPWLGGSLGVVRGFFSRSGPVAVRVVKKLACVLSRFSFWGVWGMVFAVLVLWENFYFFPKQRH